MSNDTLIIEDSFTHVLPAATNAVSGFQDLEEKLTEITKILGTEEWKGGSYDNCVNIHALIHEYHSQLKPFCDELETAVSTLGDRKDNFRKSFGT